MVKKTFLLGFVFIVLVLLTVACGGTRAKLGQEFSLHVGESASIEGEELIIKFVKVAEDSRCPKGAECVWAGRVTCAVEITYRGVVYEVTLIPPGLTDWPPGESLDKYDITYYVEPYPEIGKKIAEDEYLLMMTITKSM